MKIVTKIVLYILVSTLVFENSALAGPQVPSKTVTVDAPSGDNPQTLGQALKKLFKGDQKIPEAIPVPASSCACTPAGCTCPTRANCGDTCPPRTPTRTVYKDRVIRTTNEVPVDRVVRINNDVVVERVVKVPTEVPVERISLVETQVPVTEVKTVPTDVVVTKVEKVPTEVPVQKIQIVEKEIPVDRIVKVPTEVPVSSGSSTAPVVVHVHLNQTISPTQTVTVTQNPTQTVSTPIVRDPVVRTVQPVHIDRVVRAPVVRSIPAPTIVDVRPRPVLVDPCPTPSCTSSRRTVRVSCPTPAPRVQYVSAPAPTPPPYQAQPYCQEPRRSYGILGGLARVIFGGDTGCRNGSYGHGSSYGGYPYGSYQSPQYQVGGHGIRPPHTQPVSRGYPPQQAYRQPTRSAPQYRSGPGNDWNWRNRPTAPYFRFNPDGTPNPNYSGGHRSGTRRY